MVTSRQVLSLALCGLFLACRGEDVYQRNERDLTFGLEAFHSEPQRDHVLERLNRVLAYTQAEPDDFALQRFYAAFLLAQMHTAASLAGPFLTEPTGVTSRIGGIGQPESGEFLRTRPSAAAHLVATIYHASYARSMYEPAVRSGPQHDGVQLVPEQLWALGVDRAHTSLQVLITVAYFRLGFWEEVDEILSRSPDLLEPERAQAFLDRCQVQTRLRPWVFAMVFEYLRDKDELLAYRFGILAVEGKERFGQALPQEEVDHIEHWILEGASVMFVDPESQMEYVPGQRRSPISGVPHYEYIAVQRP